MRMAPYSAKLHAVKNLNRCHTQGLAEVLVSGTANAGRTLKCRSPDPIDGLPFSVRHLRLDRQGLVHRDFPEARIASTGGRLE